MKERCAVLDVLLLGGTPITSRPIQSPQQCLLQNRIGFLYGIR
jgi:hypothetical protein